MPDFLNDFKLGQDAFRNKVLPVLLKTKAFKNTEWRNVELTEEDYKGIDYHFTKENKDYTVAVRIQEKPDWHYSKFETFTIRCFRPTGNFTEFYKILNAIENNTTYPNFYLQAYLKGDWDSEFNYGAIAKTEELWTTANKLCLNQKLRTTQNGEQFLFIDFNKVHGVFIF